MLKTASFHLLILLGATLTALHAADITLKPISTTPPEFVAITDDPKLPRVLLMGDLVSIACGRSLCVEGLARLQPRQWRGPAGLAFPHG